MKSRLSTLASILLTITLTQPTAYGMATQPTVEPGTQASADSSTKQANQKCIIVCRGDLATVEEDSEEEALEIKGAAFVVNPCRIVEDKYTVLPAKKRKQRHPIIALAAHNMGESNTIYYGTKSNIHAWNLETNKSIILAPKQTPYMDTITALTPLYPFNIFATGDITGTVCIWNSHKKPKSIYCSEEQKPVISLAAIDEKTLAVSRLGESISLIDLRSDTKDPVIIPDTNSALALAVLPNHLLAAGFPDGTIKIINPLTQKFAAALTGHVDWVGALIALDDGRLISGSYDNTIKIWRPTNTTYTAFECTATLKGPCAPILSLALLSKDRLASGCQDGTIYIWDICTMKRINVLDDHAKAVTALAVYNDTYLISGSLDTTVKVRAI